ncbi:MAG: hypothetical protein Q9225_002363 [Loekoesia sp. 1 TL-2023]
MDPNDSIQFRFKTSDGNSWTLEELSEDVLNGITPGDFIVWLRAVNKRKWPAYKTSNLIQIFTYLLSLATERDEMSEVEIGRQRAMVSNSRVPVENIDTFSNTMANGTSPAKYDRVSLPRRSRALVAAERDVEQLPIAGGLAREFDEQAESGNRSLLFSLADTSWARTQSAKTSHIHIAQASGPDIAKFNWFHESSAMMPAIAVTFRSADECDDARWIMQAWDLEHTGPHVYIKDYRHAENRNTLWSVTFAVAIREAVAAVRESKMRKPKNRPLLRLVPMIKM